MTGVLGGLVLPWLGASGASGASAAEEVLVSVDGRSWAADLPSPLFAVRHGWTPGEQRTAVLWVRNEGPGAARLAMSARVTGPGSGSVQQLLRVHARTSGGQWTALHPRPPGAALGLLGRGVSRRVELRAVLAPQAGNDTMRERYGLALAVTLAEGEAGTRTDVGTDTPPATSPGAPARTRPPAGAPESETPEPETPEAAPGPDGRDRPWLVALAAGLCLAAAATALARPRKDTTR